MFTNPTNTPAPKTVIIEKGCRAYDAAKGARYNVLNIKDFEGGARLSLSWVGGNQGALHLTLWVRYRKHLANDTFNTNKGDPTRVVKLRVVKRRDA